MNEKTKISDIRKLVADDAQLRMWCIEQATIVKGVIEGNLVQIAKRIEDYIKGRITTP